MLYVLATVLQAPFCIIYQAVLLSSELRAIFAAAPKARDPGGRKPVKGDCPICFCALDARRPESTVGCRAACGQNMHHKCFATWARTRAGHATCSMCRTRWQGDSDTDATVASVQLDQAADNEGYANVANQLGISTVRGGTDDEREEIKVCWPDAYAERVTSFDIMSTLWIDGPVSLEWPTERCCKQSAL